MILELILHHPLDMSDQELLARTCETQPAISARIRTLAAAGWPRSKIARALGKRPQHVWNVLGPVKKPAQIAAVSPAKCDSGYLMDALKNAHQAVKQPVNLSINASILEAAKRQNVNLSEMLESALAGRLRHEAMRLWQEENLEAIEASNRFVERNGLWSDGLRLF